MGQISDNGYRRIAEGIGVPEQHRDAAVRFFKEWQRAEGADAAHNPFNSEYNEPGATNYNPVGVKNYTSEDQGVRATVATLLEPGAHKYGYDAIIHALRDGDTQAAARAVDASSWGTHGLTDTPGRAAQPQPGGPGRGNVAALQAFLATEGHAPDNSQRRDGSWDGVNGPGTQGAVESLQRSGRDGVADLQEFLAHHGHNPANSERTDGSYDGIVGPGTAQALHDFVTGR